QADERHIDEIVEHDHAEDHAEHAQQKFFAMLAFGIPAVSGLPRRCDQSYRAFGLALDNAIDAFACAVHERNVGHRAHPLADRGPQLLRQFSQVHGHRYSAPVALSRIVALSWKSIFPGSEPAPACSTSISPNAGVRSSAFLA